MTNALTVIDRARSAGALIFAPQNLECPPLFKVEVSEISARPDEFHNMKGKFMPNRAVTDRIGEAAGVDFIASECSVTQETRPAMPELSLPSRTVFVGVAQGRTRLPDGSWRYSTKVDYEFDPVLRAKSEGKGDRDALEYMKFARQRASTGARLGVIRQLVGMPVTFTAEEVKKPLVFTRVVQNTDYVLSTPEGKAMAIAMATGAAQLMYGKQPGAPEAAARAGVEDLGQVTLRQAEEQETSLAGEGDQPGGADFSLGNDDDPELRVAPKESEVAQSSIDGMIQKLEEWQNSSEITALAKGKISDALKQNIRSPKVLIALLDFAKSNAEQFARAKGKAS